MNEMNRKKYLDIINRNNKNKNSDSTVKKYLKSLGLRILIVAVIFLSLSIVCRKESSLKDKVYGYLYKEDIPFTKINKLYQKYLGGIFPIKSNGAVKEVFSESLKYDDLSIYQDGVKLSVEDSYLVPSLDEGMVVFIGEKDGYGNVVIVENLDGINFWYGNIENPSVKLYDYIEKGSLVGEANKTLYLVFSKDDKYLNYEEYLS